MQRPAPKRILKERCPHCGAHPGDYCRNADGKLIKGFHTKRTKLCKYVPLDRPC